MCKDGLGGATLAQKNLNNLQMKRLDLSLLRGQRYYGAASMPGVPRR
jgi:hypothetical protein